MKDTIRSLRQHYRATLFASFVLMFVALLAYLWISAMADRAALHSLVRVQGKQLALSLEDAAEVVRSHVYSSQRMVEHALVRSEALNRQETELIISESGSLHVDPAAQMDQRRFNRNLSAAATLLPDAAAAHQWSRIFQWTYFYDASAEWFLIYPFLPREDLLRATGTGDMSMALRTVFDADGTRPLDLVGPRNNPERAMRWTRVYDDASGRGAMITLLAPVYLADEFIGAVGTDVTLEQVSQVLKAHAPEAGRVLLVDAEGTVVADSRSGTPWPGGGLATRDAVQLRFPLKDTNWTLIVDLSDDELAAIGYRALGPSVVLAGALFLALLAIVWFQHRRYARPALLLAEHVSKVDELEDPLPPSLPRVWGPLFERVAAAARERRALLQHTQAEAAHLQQRVAEQSAHLQATTASLEQARQALVRSDKLGALGGLVASVTREVSMPLEQGERLLEELAARLVVFREQQQRGLLRAELTAFVDHLEASSQMMAGRLGDASLLLQRFRQMALDQTRDKARAFYPRETVDNVLALLQAKVRRHGCQVENAISASLTVTADVGTLGQILHHLLEDAVGRSQAGQTIRIAAGWASGSASDELEILLFDAAVTPQQGDEEGIALAMRLATDGMDGQLEVTSSADGNRFALRFPCTEASEGSSAGGAG
ncbi:MAG: hypothetical protein VW877_14440 [Pseudomonadaceae bacterium]